MSEDGGSSSVFTLVPSNNDPKGIIMLADPTTSCRAYNVSSPNSTRIPLTINIYAPSSFSVCMDPTIDMDGQHWRVYRFGGVDGVGDGPVVLAMITPQAWCWLYLC